MKTALAVCFLAPVAALALTACSSTSSGPCERGLVTTLYLGRSIPGGGTVDDAALQTFLSDVVAKQFPNGFTVLHGEGWWRPGPAAPPQHEGAVVLQFVRCDDKQGEDALVVVGREYAERFRQQSILRTDVRARIDW